MNTDSTMQSQMEQIAHQLAEAYGEDLSRTGAFLRLDMPTRPDRWMIANLDGERLSLMRYVVEEDERVSPDETMTFMLTLSDAAPGLPAIIVSVAEPPPGLDQEDLLIANAELPAPDWDDDPPRRIAGCQSANHAHCYGELWHCAACGKTVCYAEGSDNRRELCDDCWAMRPDILEYAAPAEFMEQFVHDLIARYEADVLPNGCIYLELHRKDHGVLIIEETAKRQEMHVRYQLYDAEGNPVPEPDIAFLITSDGYWIPYAIYRFSAGWHTFADLDVARGELVITDPKNQASLTYFADFWAEVLRSQGWEKFATKHHGQPRLFVEPDDAPPTPPSVEDLWDWVDEYGKCRATDGCWTEPDGTCEHGYPSWLVELGLI